MALFAVDKPLGITSHDVVDAIRKQLGTRRVGHTGTLDPLATGVLILASDASTKLVPFLSAEDKEYLAWVSFGATTETLDAEGPVTAEVPARFSRRDLETTLTRFLSLTEQVPPAYSAVKVGGVKAYEAARKGESLELVPRPVRYLEATLLAFDPALKAYHIAPSPHGWEIAPVKGRQAPGDAGTQRGRPVALPRALGEYPTAVIRLVVGSGTYIRAFARDLGEMLGTKAFLSGLVRTRVGRVGLERCVPLEQIDPKRSLEETQVLSFPLVQLSHTEVKRVLEGVPLPIPAQGYVALLDSRRRLVAIAEGDGFKLKIKRVFKG
ncbi:MULTISPECIES: tRNA pseudouridine(55) synthase TruB [unclassified Meiothermus]|uniref:tRNA pseudouridine(55) synthase TruB n=1 Tax=unclassified Meiothermus TaxID=370471 RepID=UPI000D7BF4D7|nr:MULTISPECIES: tRNA pseudouridine(55) synthase TruB [unclassified Meiothermus]PZA07076.1 tRNA pseudouridine(55) synthase TruB [Meiothermus sp. Pnk-1]RYM40045.1 tRNA pseudouridine(55) synthase TruB [Meiothermus sp. PNK-Is4]